MTGLHSTIDAVDRAETCARLRAVRAATETLAAPLSAEDQQLQSMPSCSPTKWHRAHTSWFFEEFVLGPLGVPADDPRSRYLFNSYYEAVGPRHARPARGMVSRPTAAEVGAWRARVDARLFERLDALSESEWAAVAPIVVLGIAHEEQHQELLLTDILHALSQSPLQPAYRTPPYAPDAERPDGAPLGWVSFDGGPRWIGGEGAGFRFDNEGPRHRVWLEPYALGTRLVTVGEAKAFVRAGGYRDPALWLSEGLDWVRAHGIDAPGYVTVDGESWVVFGLDGPREARDDEPVAFVSYYEADALARFLGARLPTEAEWENAAGPVPADIRSPRALRPLPADGAGMTQMYGHVWQWTASPYGAYPGFTPAPGAVGEYNGKFMVNQLVLRGGSCFTPPGHTRASYRNFWHPDTRFQVTGLRLARDGD